MDLVWNVEFKLLLKLGIMATVMGLVAFTLRPVQPMSQEPLETDGAEEWDRNTVDLIHYSLQSLASVSTVIMSF